MDEYQIHHVKQNKPFKRYILISFKCCFREKQNCKNRDLQLPGLKAYEL